MVYGMGRENFCRVRVVRRRAQRRDRPSPPPNEQRRKPVRKLAAGLLASPTRRYRRGPRVFHAS
jgi:hypothetical protein